MKPEDYLKLAYLDLAVPGVILPKPALLFTTRSMVNTSAVNEIPDDLQALAPFSKLVPFELHCEKTQRVL